MKQHGAAFEKASAEERKLDAIFVCTGGSSLLAGIAAAVKQVRPQSCGHQDVMSSHGNQDVIRT